MSLFKSQKLTWWQMGIFKAALISLGIAIGAEWASILSPYIFYFLILAVVLGLYIAIIWYRK